MKLTSENVMIASLLGSQVVEQIPRFAQVENELAKRVLPPVLGDVMIFSRTGGAHVGMYVGEDKDCYHIVGGNQSNQFNIIRIAKNRLTGARRPKYKVIPKSVKKYYLEPLGKISQNEA